MLEFKNVNKSYRNDIETIDVLKNISFRIEAGEFVAIIGPSGSGKSTLLGVAAGLDQPDSGQINFDGVELTTTDESKLADLRAEKIGFIFQNFQLLPGFTALENVAIPLFIKSNLNEIDILSKARKVLDSVSMSHRSNHYPKQLSGGEEQRIAIARSFINDPRVLFADEPTANLDSKNSKNILQLLLDRNKALGSTLVVVTHDPDVAKLADRVLEMKDGQIVSDSSSLQKKRKQSKKTVRKGK